MKQIELKDFIDQVRDELLKAHEKRSDNPTFEVTEVELEVSFTRSTEGNAKGKLLVLDLEGNVGVERAHKVTIRMKPQAKTADDMGKLLVGRAKPPKSKAAP